MTITNDALDLTIQGPPYAHPPLVLMSGAIEERTVWKRTVRILLECFLFHSVISLIYCYKVAERIITVEHYEYRIELK